MASRPPLIVTSGKALAAARLDVVRRGYRLIDGFRSASNGSTDDRRVAYTGPIRTPADVSAAIALAAGGAGVVAEAPRSAELLAALVDDLRRIGLVELPGIVEDDELSREERALLELLGSGMSVTAAAAEIHVSRRTAQRLLVRAKAKLGASSTVDAIARAADPV